MINLYASCSDWTGRISYKKTVITIRVKALSAVLNIFSKLEKHCIKQNNAFQLIKISFYMKDNFSIYDQKYHNFFFLVSFIFQSQKSRSDLNEFSLFCDQTLHIYKPGERFMKSLVRDFHQQICSLPIRCKDSSSLW